VFEGQLCDTGFPISSQALPANAKSTGSLDNPDNFPISRFLRDKGITRVVVTGLAADYW
jgi:nicotinamidase-related amidase